MVDTWIRRAQLTAWSTVAVTRQAAGQAQWQRAESTSPSPRSAPRRPRGSHYDDIGARKYRVGESTFLVPGVMADALCAYANPPARTIRA